MSVDHRLALNHVTVILPRKAPSFVNHAVTDLRRYVQEVTGQPCPAASAVPAKAGRRGKAADGKRVFFAIGADTAAGLLGAPPSHETLGDEGYVLKSLQKDGRTWVIAAGATSRGTNHAIAALMRHIRLGPRGQRAFIDLPVDLVTRPQFPLRGMHLNGWSIKYPHAFRRWREQDWLSYIDLLYYQGVNLLYFWPFMEIMPLPLSTADRRNLEEYRRIVDYAQNRRGMTVWMMQSANRVGENDAGVRDPKLRPYWLRHAQVDMDPRNPQQIARMLRHSLALYEILNNVNGVCLIDCDPGAWVGADLKLFTGIFNKLRRLLNETNIHGKDCTLVNWMWGGWGYYGGVQDFWQEPDLQRQALQHFKRHMPEPWMLIAGCQRYLERARDERLLDRTVFLPYNFIECEPVLPQTNVTIEYLRERVMEPLAATGAPAGFMGNVQTPQLQLPNMLYFNHCQWDLSARAMTRSEVLNELAELLYPDSRGLVADCFEALVSTDPGFVRSCRRKLALRLAQGRMGRPGLLGRKLFPDPLHVAKMLLPQLRMEGAMEELRHALAGSPSQCTLQTMLIEWFDACLEWDGHHGYSILIDIGIWRKTLLNLDTGAEEFFRRLKQAARISTAAEAAAFVLPIQNALVRRHNPYTVMHGGVLFLRDALLNPAVAAHMAAKTINKETLPGNTGQSI